MKRIIYTIIIYTITKFSLFSQVCVGTPGQITWQVFRGIYDDEVSYLTTWHDYPYHPYETKTLYSSKSEVNYDNAMGARMMGYIYVPQSDSVTFNLTGNEQAQFFLSTDANPANKVLMASLVSNTGAEEFTKFATQTSIKLYLQQGVNYYFEVLYVDGTGNDYANLWWKAPFVDIANWKPITANYLKNVACLPSECPKAGTPCDDGDATTTNDLQDGYCHCIGQKSNANVCIGPRAFVENYRYDNISGSTLNDLYNNSAYPAMPSFTEVLPILAKPSISGLNNFGRSTQAYLKVPISGNYKFNITGDDYTAFFLSSDDNPANKTANYININGNTLATQFDKYSSQTSGSIYLDASKFYFVELNNKQSGGGAHFSLFWQTPFTEPNTWKRVPNTFLYKYDCTLACMPAGAICDDGNPFSNNDIYNSSCECIGTPCTPPNCTDPLANYLPYEKCSVTDLVDNRSDVSWISCKKQPNPNTLRPTSHWIKYDLGQVHRLLTSQIWNYNVAGSTSLGFQNVAIDYSLDGVTWTEFGTYNWQLATGSASYGGFIGPNFQNTSARYVLITSLDAGPNSCKGLSKISFKAVYCPPLGTSCNDFDITTTDDRYDDNCLCAGIPLYENLCMDEIKILGDSLIYATNYSAKQYVKSISDVKSYKSTSFIAGDYVELNPGFSTQDYAVFVAAIDTCGPNLKPALTSVKKEEYQSKIKVDQNSPIIISKVENSDIVNVDFLVNKEGVSTLEILNSNLIPISSLASHNFDNKGYYSKQFRTKKLESGVYTIKLFNDGQFYFEKFVVE